MTLSFSPVVPARTIQMGDNQVFSSRSVNLSALAEWASPILTLDHYRLTGAPFLPHPHAGFTAIAYVLEDSSTPLRTRDVFGNDMITDAGGLLLTEAGSGVVHEDTTLDQTREMHGIQCFINHTQPNKYRSPRVQQVPSGNVPVWSNGEGDTVRVVLGSYASLTSPVKMIEPCTMLDATLSSTIPLKLEQGQNLMVFVIAGKAVLHAGDEAHRIGTDEAIGVGGGPASLELSALDNSAQAIIVAGLAIDVPYIRHGNAFFMNSQEEIDAAVIRHERGEMGTLVPRGQL